VQAAHWQHPSGRSKHAIIRGSDIWKKRMQHETTPHDRTLTPRLIDASPIHLYVTTFTSPHLTPPQHNNHSTPQSPSMMIPRMTDSGRIRQTCLFACLFKYHTNRRESSDHIMKGRVAVVLLVSAVTSSLGYDNGVARTPPMGWNCALHPTPYVLVESFWGRFVLTKPVLARTFGAPGPRG
jgi:hypothetical protein